MLDAVFSFVVDSDPVFAYQGLHLARSLLRHTNDITKRIYVQVTPEVGAEVRVSFERLGCEVRQIERFGDGAHCNKLSQFAALTEADWRYAVLLDADMIAIDDLAPLLSGEKLRGRVAGAASPSRGAFEALAQLSALESMPGVILADCVPAETFEGYFNGGLYVVPRALAAPMAEAWRSWTLWLLEHGEPLKSEGKTRNADQVGLWLAIHHAGLPFEAIPANWNYNPARQHRTYDARLPIAMLHYHRRLDTAGRISAPDAPEPNRAAIAVANRAFALGHDSRAFWDFRYRSFPERGSGVGSRGDNAAYKRALLVAEGIQAAESVLDVGCGDLEVLKALSIKGYLGVDQSAEAVRIASAMRPDWAFAVADLEEDGEDLPAKDFVLCLEVLIHQPTAQRYHAVLRMAAAKCRRSLIVSGFAEIADFPVGAASVFFHEPLAQSLEALGVFSSIQEIGRHTSVTIFRCDR